MLIVTSKLPYRRQPTARLFLDFAHPMSRGMVFCSHYSTNVCRNSATRHFFTEVSRAGVTATSVGDDVAILRSNSAVGNGIDLGSAAGILTSLSGCTIFGEMGVLDVNQWVSLLQAGQIAANGLALSWAGDGLGALGAPGYRVAVGNSFGYVTTTNVAYQTVAMVFDGTGATDADKLKLYVGGALQPLLFSGAIPTTTPGSYAENLWLGRYRHAGAVDRAGNATIGPIRVYTRPLSQDEILDLGENPYQMIGVNPYRRFFFPSSGTPNTVIVTPGTQSDVGYGLNVVQPRQIDVATGTQSDIGYSLGVVQSNSKIVQTGTQTDVGYTLNISQPRSIQVTPGNQNDVGYTLNVSQAQARQVSTGTQLDVGYALGVSQPRSIQVMAGTQLDEGYTLNVNPGVAASVYVSGVGVTGLTDFNSQFGVRVGAVGSIVISSTGLLIEVPVDGTGTVPVLQLQPEINLLLVDNSDTVPALSLLTELRLPVFGGSDVFILSIEPDLSIILPVVDGDDVVLPLTLLVLAPQVVDETGLLRSIPDPSLLPKLLNSIISEANLPIKKIHPVVVTEPTGKFDPPYLVFKIENWQPEILLDGGYHRRTTVQAQLLLVSKGYQQGKDLIRDILEVIWRDDRLGLGTFSLEDGDFDEDTMCYTNILTANFITD